MSGASTRTYPNFRRDVQLGAVDNGRRVRVDGIAEPEALRLDPEPQFGVVGGWRLGSAENGHHSLVLGSRHRLGLARLAVVALSPRPEAGVHGSLATVVRVGGGPGRCCLVVVARGCRCRRGGRGRQVRDGVVAGQCWLMLCTVDRHVVVVVVADGRTTL